MNHNTIQHFSISSAEGNYRCSLDYPQSCHKTGPKAGKTSPTCRLKAKTHLEKRGIEKKDELHPQNGNHKSSTLEGENMTLLKSDFSSETILTDFP